MTDTEHGAPMTDEELAAVGRRAIELHDAGHYMDSEFPVTGALMMQVADDVRRLVAEVQRLRAENVKFKHDVTAIIEREVQRAEEMGNKPDEYPKQYVGGRYRTAIEILGQLRMMLVIPSTINPFRDGK